jgi:hypothetical protein
MAAARWSPLRLKRTLATSSDGVNENLFSADREEYAVLTAGLAEQKLSDFFPKHIALAGYRASLGERRKARYLLVQVKHPLLDNLRWRLGNQPTDRLVNVADCLWCEINAVCRASA